MAGGWRRRAGFRPALRSRSVTGAGVRRAREPGARPLFSRRRPRAGAVCRGFGGVVQRIRPPLRKLLQSRAALAAFPLLAPQKRVKEPRTCAGPEPAYPWFQELQSLGRRSWRTARLRLKRERGTCESPRIARLRTLREFMFPPCFSPCIRRRL